MFIDATTHFLRNGQEESVHRHGQSCADTNLTMVYTKSQRFESSQNDYNNIFTRSINSTCCLYQPRLPMVRDFSSGMPHGTSISSIVCTSFKRVAEYMNPNLSLISAVSALPWFGIPFGTKTSQRGRCEWLYFDDSLRSSSTTGHAEFMTLQL